MRPQQSKVRVTPVARRLAEELGIDLTQIAGRGPKGRIHKADVLAFQKSQSAAEHRTVPVAAPASTVSAPPVTPIPAGQPARIPLPDARQKQVLPLTGARKIIAERMAYSTFTAPAHSTCLCGWI